MVSQSSSEPIRDRKRCTDFQVDATAFNCEYFLEFPFAECEGIQTRALFVDAGLLKLHTDNADASSDVEPFVEAGAQADVGFVEAARALNGFGGVSAAFRNGRNVGCRIVVRVGVQKVRFPCQIAGERRPIVQIGRHGAHCRCEECIEQRRIQGGVLNFNFFVEIRTARTGDGKGGHRPIGVHRWVAQRDPQIGRRTSELVGVADLPVDVDLGLY